MVSLRPGQYLKTSPMRMMLLPLLILSRFLFLFPTAAHKTVSDPV